MTTNETTPAAPAIQRQRFHVHVHSQPVWAREWLPGSTLGPLATSIPRGHYVAEVREVGPAKVEWVCLLGGEFQGRTVGNFYDAWIKGGARLEQVRPVEVAASEAVVGEADGEPGVRIESRPNPAEVIPPGRYRVETADGDSFPVDIHAEMKSIAVTIAGSPPAAAGRPESPMSQWQPCPHPALDALCDQALAEHRAGLTEPIDDSFGGPPNVLTAWGEFPIEGEASGDTAVTAAHPGRARDGGAAAWDAEKAKLIDMLDEWVRHDRDGCDCEPWDHPGKVCRLCRTQNVIAGRHPMFPVVKEHPLAITPVPLTDGQTAAIEDLLEQNARLRAIVRQYRDQHVDLLFDKSQRCRCGVCGEAEKVVMGDGDGCDVVAVASAPPAATTGPPDITTPGHQPRDLRAIEERTGEIAGGTTRP